MNHRLKEWAPGPDVRSISAAAPQSKGGTPPSVAERIAAELRDEILRGRYQAGDRLPSERDLAEHFGAHRGAIREALKKLEQLGIAEIKPGGVRAAPIETASLDIVPHLIELDPPHNAELFGQVLEMFGGVLSLAARLAAERASDAQRIQAIAILEQLMDEKRPLAEEEELIQSLTQILIEASGNMVLGLVRNGLHSRYIERLIEQGTVLRPTDAERKPILRRLIRALAESDGPGAADATFEINQSVRRNTLALWKTQHAESNGHQKDKDKRS
ncbi:MAG: hypothetical protein CBC48_08805 [bacterium TMED88]|nr:hypothetical protein [Deltaproteobacteria bacterium]OUV32092.1 MAG: hypothetical protein CBC48_08805 [bacterium TMED88]